MLGNLGVALSEACRKFDRSTAINAECATLTYAELALRAGEVSDLLREAGLGRNEPVHVNVSNTIFDWAALLGVWLAGGVAVPVHRSMPAALCAAIQGKTCARFLLDMPAAANGAAGPLSIAGAAAPPRAMLDDAALIIFTSGSTGTPKGVVVSHHAFHGKIEQIDSLLRFQPDERSLLVLNITFSFGLWVSLLTLLRGGTLFMHEKFEPARFLQALVENRITRVGVVPTMMRVLFSRPDLAVAIDRAAAGELRQVWMGGESLGATLAVEIRQRFSHAGLVDIYGLTETSTCDFFLFPEDYARYPGCIGRPAPDVRYRIVDADGAVAAADAVGELQIQSPYLMNGYLDEPELSAAAFDHGWFKTGDLAKKVDGEVVQLMGRKKELISRGGNKVTPVEIEQSLCAYPDVTAAMAVGVADAVLGERIHVLLVPRSGTRLELPALKQFLGNRLEKFKQPDAYYIADTLPLGRTGKADRGQFKSLIESGAIKPA